ncbi:MAG TPA: hydantoinase/oxoprolinase family protein [Acidimicrobiales bacterium]|nr:hydantoinase/oxoprolinase family protein [Acidimicrobiales bacterium]
MSDPALRTGAPAPPGRRLRIAVDIGGTFVDAVEFDSASGSVRVRKSPTTPAEPAAGVLAALDALGTDLGAAEVLVHGTTLGLNAILEGRGARVGILSSEGFRDVFLIGRGNIPEAHMYDFSYRRPPAIVRRRHTAGVAERVDARGNVVVPLDEARLCEAARRLVEEEHVEALALCFLHSYRSPEHERRAAAILRERYPELAIAVSSEIAREHREFERTATTVLDAYIKPIFRRYLDDLDSSLARRGFGGQFLVMRSGGGAMLARAARDAPTTTVLSGPAGGVIGASVVASILGSADLMSIDVGGTSLDAAVVTDGKPAVVHETTLGELPLLTPVFDIRTMGAGGGSIARVDDGILRVGPQSAGADPGPICYGRGGSAPTTTDAAAVLGYLDPAGYLSGAMPLDEEAARAGIAELVAAPLGLPLAQAAAGILSVMAAGTTGALRQLAVERGRDLGEYTLLAFGGAGPLFVPLIAREVGARQVVVPTAPAVFSAWGMLGIDVVEEVGRSVLVPLDDTVGGHLASVLSELSQIATSRVQRQCSPGAELVTERQLELRYAGQEHALGVEVGGAQIDATALAERFGEAHGAAYGHRLPSAVQVLACRVRVSALLEKPQIGRIEAGDGDPAAARLGRRPAWDFATAEPRDFAVYDRARLRAGDRLDGPAIVDEGNTVSVLQSDQRCVVNEFGHLVIGARHG